MAAEAAAVAAAEVSKIRTPRVGSHRTRIQAPSSFYLANCTLGGAPEAEHVMHRHADSSTKGGVVGV